MKWNIKNRMKLFLFSVVLILITISVTGCGGSGGLYALKSMNIKKVAIISIRTDTRLHAINKSDVLSVVANTVQDIGKGGLDQNITKKLDEKEVSYIINTMKELQIPFNKLIAKYEIVSVTPEDLLSNGIYNATPLTKAEAGTYYSVPPYKNIEQPIAEDLAKLCQDLGVDAVITYRSYFEREAYRDIVQIPLTPDYMKFFAKLDIMVFGKDGQTIFQKRYEGVSPEIIGYNNSQYQFSFKNVDMARVIKNTVQALKNNIDNDIKPLL